MLRGSKRPWTLSKVESPATMASGATEKASPTAAAEAGATGNWQYTAQVTTTFGAATYINEHGLFNQPAVSGATLWDRSVYANTPMAQNESMTFQYILTIQSGG